MIQQRTLLVVDSDAGVVGAFRSATRALRVRLTCAATVGEASLAVAAEVPDIIISDHRMPDGDGLSFLQHVHRMHPAVKRILYTGPALYASGYGLDIPVLEKPCAPTVLRELIESLLGDLGDRRN